MPYPSYRTGSPCPRFRTPLRSSRERLRRTPRHAANVADYVRLGADLRWFPGAADPFADPHVGWFAALHWPRELRSFGGSYDELATLSECSSVCCSCQPGTHAAAPTYDPSKGPHKGGICEEHCTAPFERSGANKNGYCGINNVNAHYSQYLA